MPSNQQQIIEQAKFTCFSLGKAFEKRTKTIKDQGEKQVDALGALKPKELKPKEVKPIECDNYLFNGLKEIRDSTKSIDFNNLIHSFKGPKINLKGHYIFLKVYIMAIKL